MALQIRRCISLLCLLTLLCWCACAFGEGQPSALDTFEQDATSQQQQPEPHHHKHDDRDNEIWPDTDKDDFGLCAQLGKAIFEMAGYSGVLSWIRVTNPSRCTSAGVAPRKPGDPLLPFARLDFDARQVSNDIQGGDLFAEAGLGPLGVQYGETNYQEVNPLDTLKIKQCYGLYRMSFSSSFEMDLGFGQMELDGNSQTTQSAFTLPILVHPQHSHLGFELHPAWTSTISDYDLAAFYSWDYTSLKAGYRWFLSTHDSLSGPYIGMSVRL